jgi:hypothetical protein
MKCGLRLGNRQQQGLSFISSPIFLALLSSVVKGKFGWTFKKSSLRLCHATKPTCLLELFDPDKVLNQPYSFHVFRQR